MIIINCRMCEWNYIFIKYVCVCCCKFFLGYVWWPLQEHPTKKRTFIINKSVLNTINIIMKYSNGVDTTIRHTLYLKLFRLLGMYRSNGRAPIVKSMQDFYAPYNNKWLLVMLICQRFAQLIMTIMKQTKKVHWRDSK